MASLLLRVVDQPVDGAGRGHGVFEDAVPIAEDQIAGDEDALAFVPLGQEGEEHLHFVAALLDVADVVEDHGMIDVERGEFAFEAQVALGGQQPLDERVGRGEQDSVAVLDKLVADGCYDVALASAGQSEDEQIFPALDEAAFAQARHLLHHLGRQPTSFESCQSLLRRKI